MTVSAPDTVLHLAAADLDAALFLALQQAQNDGDGLLSTWADIARSISLASTGLLGELAAPLEPIEHPDCLTALRAASDQVSRLRPDVDVPLTDLATALPHLAAAQQHAQALQDAQLARQQP